MGRFVDMPNRRFKVYLKFCSRCGELFRGSSKRSKICKMCCNHRGVVHDGTRNWV